MNLLGVQVLPLVMSNIMFPYELAFLWALGVTLLCEIPIAAYLIRGVFKQAALSWERILLACGIASALTLPYLWFVLPHFIYLKTTQEWVGESLVVLVEAVLYWRVLGLKPSQAGIVSFVANVASWAIGPHLTRLI